MLEGLLLLDRNRKIYLANRAFKNLFGIKAELRGKPSWKRCACMNSPNWWSASKPRAKFLITS